MLGAMRLFQRDHCADIKRFGLSVLLLGAVQFGQVDLDGGDVGMGGAEYFLIDGDGTPVERLGLGVATVIVVKHRQFVEM